MRYLDGRGPLFEQRIAEGRAVDGHGDLLADDIFCLDDGPRILDCIEFDDALRLGDGLSDAAFLAMDLERLGRPDLGRAVPRLPTGRRRPTSGRPRSSTTTSPTERRSEPRWPPSVPPRATAHSVARRPASPRTGPRPPDGWSGAARAGRRAPRHREVDARGRPRTRARHVRRPVRRAPQGARARSVVDAGRDGLLPRSLRPCRHRRDLRADAKRGGGRARPSVSPWCSTRRGRTPTSDDLARVLAASLHADLVEIRCELPEEIADRAPSRPHVRRWRRIRCHPGDRRAHGGAGRAVAGGARRSTRRSRRQPSLRRSGSSPLPPPGPTRERSGQRDVPGHQRPARAR